MASCGGGGGGGGGNGRGQRRQPAADDAGAVGGQAGANADAAGGGAGTRGAAANAAGNRNDWGIVWKELPDHSLQPVRVRQGVTDFTFTAMEEGDLKVGDQLVIGEVTTAASTVQPATPAPGLGGGRGGLGGGFRGGLGR